jgi:thiosulfate/3-mercaptopyruvate sulfurtransferase
MAYTTLATTEDLFEHLSDPSWTVVDCRFSLAEPELGRREYEEAHIPGALYAHLDEDLSGPIVPGRTGRHPLPTPEQIARRFGSWGIGPGQQVVAYDAAGGGIAARLWWLLRWLGHDEVAVLDGGWQEWQRHGYPVSDGVETARPVVFTPLPREDWVVSTDEVDVWRKDPDFLLVDSRAADRYRGENETIDPVAGHIPGAISLPYGDNLDENGRFRSREALRERFAELFHEVPPKHTAFYCGSGVTAAHNLLALSYAGYDEARLYPGSWSEWITDPARAVARIDDSA